jgi:hypothetical protein
MTTRDKITGVLRVKPVKRLTSASITILPRSKSEPLHPAVLDCPEIRSAINARPRRVSVLEE